jgi:chaperone required for assembly of F1-ATPase
MSDDKPPAALPGKESLAKPLPKRFYKAAVAASRGDGHGVLLDGRPARTPAKAELRLPTRALAEAVAAEWDAQTSHVDPATMPLTRLANTAIDGVARREADVRADIAKFAGSDLLCYRAGGPSELVARQSAAWDPVLEWVAATLGIRLILAEGVMPVHQAPEAMAAVARALEPHRAFALAALHTMTTLTGSALLALAVVARRLSAEEAWAAAHVDEDWQISQWGEDAEAAARRRRRWQEMAAAARLIELGTPP